MRVKERGPWRVLLFNNIEQGLTYMMLPQDYGRANPSDEILRSDPAVLGYDYLRVSNISIIITINIIIKQAYDGTTE
jgi:hypothetical protein